MEFLNNPSINYSIDLRYQLEYIDYDKSELSDYNYNGGQPVFVQNTLQTRLYSYVG